ncbi:MAG: aminopeptidase P family protein [Actinobacteria bacterium]|nr:aminopeptidase P family protein [Actinomycetota bacterium]
MSERHLDRLRRAGEQALAQEIGAVVVAPSPDLAYLSGYDPPPFERLTLLVIRPGDDPVLVVPALERPLALASPVGGALEVVGWRDGEDPYDAAARLLPSDALVAAGDRMWALHLLGLQRALPGASFTSASPVISPLRSVKDLDELAALSRAARAADESFRQICGARFEGRHEEDLAGDLSDLLVRNGHGRADFAIVASGPNSASPHHEPGARTIRPRDVVVMDFGGELGGYFSDTTRTVVVGEPPEGLPEVFDTVRAAHDAALAAVRPGVTAQDVDRAARRVVEAAGYGERFIHRTGHGIGLEVHEPPWLVEGNEVELRPGMTFSVEPGVYLDGRFGVRIEDIVVVTHEGVDRLNRSTRDLQIVS